MLINKINFQNTIYNKKQISFKGEYDDRVRRMEDRNSIFSSAYWKAEQIVENQMRSEIRDLERQIARKEAELESREQAERSANNYHSSSLSSKRSQLSNIKSQISYNKSIISDYHRTLSQLGSQKSSLQSANYSAQTAIDEQKKTIENLKTETENLSLQNEEYQKQLKKDFSEKIKVIEAEYQAKEETLKNNINSSIIKPDSINKEINTPKSNGFGRIAGFAGVKADLINKFGRLIVLEKNNKTINIPNAILLYGPDTDNNNEFANILAEQFGVRSIQISTEGSEVERFNKLKEASAKAKAGFENGQGRTLIVINDFDKFAPKDSRIVGPLKSYLDTISKDFHATIIATTSIPEALDDILLRSGRFGAKIAVPAMDKADMLSCIHKYINLDFIDNIDINKLIQNLDSERNGGAYSVKQLKDFIKSLTNINDLNTLVPDIKSNAIKVFKQQMEYVKHI